MSWFERNHTPFSYEKYPSVATLNADLNLSGDIFFQLFDSLHYQDWSLKKPGREWTVREIMYHSVTVLQSLPEEIHLIKQGKRRTLPSFVSPAMWDELNYLVTHIRSRSVPVRELPALYHQAQEHMHTALIPLDDTDWQKGTELFGRYKTIGEIVQEPLQHMRFHQYQIWETLQFHEKIK